MFEVDAHRGKRFIHFADLALVVELGILKLEHFFDVLLYHLGLCAMMIVLLDLWTLLPPYLIWDGQF